MALLINSEVVEAITEYGVRFPDGTAFDVMNEQEAIELAMSIDTAEVVQRRVYVGRWESHQAS